MNTRLHVLTIAAIAALSMSTLVSAEQLTPAQALARLSNDKPAMAPATGNVNIAQPVYTAKVSHDTMAAYYVFDDANGYMIVSADDVAYPLLGYVEGGKFDATDIPSNMQWWLDSYKKQIEWAIENNVRPAATVSATTITKAPVSPLVQTLWDQESPYNLYCPEINDTVAPTGCVATAMAQIMYYHQWPETGRGSNSFTNNGQTLSIDFSTVHFDWSNMTTTYSSASSESAKVAVATLMKACGYAVNMDYGTKESGAYNTDIPNAYYTYFDYDKSVNNVYRDYYTLGDWENIIYGELAASRPIQYGGTGSAGGHSFVVDGYSQDGYFHINWGWSGMSNGYYKLMALDPPSLGTGGGAGGFNSNQVAVIGIEHSDAPVAADIIVLSSDGFSAGTTSAYSGQTVSFYPNAYGSAQQSTLFYNSSMFTANGRLGLRLNNTTTGANQYLQGSSFTNVKQNYGSQGFSVTLNNIAEGTYNAYPAYYDSATDKWNDVGVPISTNQYLTLQVSGSQINISQPASSAQLTISDVTFDGDVSASQDFSVTANATNSGSTFYGLVYGAFLTVSSGQYSMVGLGGSVSIEVDANGNETFTLDGTANVSAGTYQFAFLTESASTGSYSIVSQPVSVTVTAAGTLGISEMSVQSVNGVVPKDNIVVTGTATATGGAVNQSLTIVIFPNFTSSSTGEIAAVGSMVTDNNIVLNDGESGQFSAHGSLLGGEAGKQYFVYARNADGWVGNRAFFTLSEPVTTGVDDVEGNYGDIEIVAEGQMLHITSTGETPLHHIEVYGANGAMVEKISCDGQGSVTIDASSFGPGLFVVKAVNSVKTEVDKIRI